jgi:hypothetical protein
MTYQRFPIETDPDALAKDSYDLLASKTGGIWQPADGNLDTWLLEATARMAAEVRDVAADVPDAIFRTYGEELIGLQPLDPTSAQAVLNLTLRDTAAYVIPPGTTFAVEDLTGEAHAFATTDETTILEDDAAPSPRIVQLVAYALVAGADASGIAPRPDNAYLLDALAYVTAVALAAPTSGGSDGESDDDYMTRLAGYLTLLAPRPILPNDFAILALQIEGVGFAAAANLYNADTEEWNTARCVTVIIADPNGEPVTAAVKQQVQDTLQAAREVNFLVFVVDPTYTDVDVDYQFYRLLNYDAAGVEADVNAALTAYFQPATFAAQGGEGGQVAGLWTPQDAIHSNDLYAVVQGVAGVQRCSVILVNGSADAVLDGPVGQLPRPGTMSGTCLN